ncbi:MAG: PAS domain S-box protein [Algoriphagus sp.]|uniref:PAS domain S-box protein n=1 Tax=Algoriphagus sp. TaxID=1872435 RepID=UPI002731D010|nr:PAS domain S-box protein [Algoriphagus sp.]MDP2042571.1 PAS domain S-box protein [Algoriphagus sp.]MDP3472726.1 PAS domain S-box protein [Algoriphagus sp.]
MNKGPQGPKANPKVIGNETSIKIEQKDFLFLLLNSDLKLDFISDENLRLIREELAWNIEVGSYLPDLFSGQAKDFFIEQLAKGFSGHCFSFGLTLPSHKNNSKTTDVMVTPSHLFEGQFTKIGLAIHFREESTEEVSDYFTEVEKRFEKLKQGLKSSELKYEYLFENNPAPMFVWDRDTLKIIAVNERFERLYGYTKAESLAMTILDIRPKEDFDRLVSLASDDNKFSNYGQGAFNGLSKHIKKSGELMDVEVNAQAIIYEDRRASLVLVQDVTQKILSDTLDALEFELMESAIQTDADLVSLLKEFLKGYETAVKGIKTSLLKVEEGRVFNLATPSIGVDFIDLIDGLEIGSEEGACGSVAFTGKRIFTADISTDPKWEKFKDSAAEQGFKSCVSFPVFNSEKEVIASFAIYFLEKWEEKPEDLERYQKAASVFSLILENHIKKEELKLSNERYEYVNLATKDALYDWDILKDKLFWGKSYEKFLGPHTTPNGSEVKNWENLLHPDDQSRVIETLSLDLSNPDKEDFKLEYQIRRNDGSYACVTDRAIFIRDKSGRAIRMIGVLSDVTQQRLEESRLKLLESVVTYANDAVMITEAEPISLPGPRIVYVNEAFTRMTGYAEEEVLGKSPRILQGPNSDKKELKRLREAMGNWQPCEITTINYKKNGEEFWTNFSISPVADSKGWFTHWISIQREVSSQKIEDQKKELLAQVIQAFGEERRFNFALDRSLEKLVKFNVLDAGEIWLVNSDKTKLNLISRYALSDAGSRFFSMVDKKLSFRIGEGLPGQIWGKNDILSFDDLTEANEFTRRQAMLASGMNGAFGFPLHFSGLVIGVALFTTQNKSGYVNSLLKVFSSLSQVLGAEIYRKKVEDELSQIFDTAQDIICIFGFDGKFKKINRGASYLLGYSEDELLSKSFMDFVHPEDWDDTENIFDSLCQGQNSIDFINRMISKSGDSVWLDWNSTVVMEEELIYSVAKDISEEKELQALLNSANKMARIGFWEVDLLNGISYWSPVTKEIHEVPGDYVPDIEMGISFYAPEAKPLIIESFYRCIQTGEPYDHELQIISAKGNRIWVRTQGQAEFRDGVCVRVYGSIQDISDLKNTQMHLKEALHEKDQILESIGDGFFSLDKDWVVTYWNPAAEILLQKPKELAMGRNIKEVLSKDSAANSIKNYKEAIDKNSPLVYEEFFTDLGTWFEISVFPSAIGISVYFKDISLRKTTEELIRQSNERFEKVAEATHEAIWDWEVPGNILYWGPGYKTLFGLDPNESGNSYRDWANQVHEEDYESVEHRVKLALEDKEIFNFQNEYRFKKADGTYAFVADKAVIIRDKSGKPTRMVGAMQDITDQKMYESSLKDLNEMLEARARELANSNAELEQFAYVASHDLQEPLRMVSSFLTQLELKYEDQLDERAKKYIYFAVDGAKRMRQIILDLLEFSRVGRIQEDLEKIDLNELLAEVCNLQSNRIKEKSAEVHFADMPVIKGYRTPMIQVFQNLISNALKYSKESLAPVVNITCRELAEYWEFSIQDNGIGMEPGHFDKIFVIFQRLHTKDKYSGSGIGLAIVKKIIENKGGKIWVESQLGTGTTFYFTLKK